jgi:hypothetical protein
LTRADLDALPTYVRPVSIPAIGRPMYCGFFNFQPAETPGNVRLNVSDLIVRGWGGQALAIYCAGSPDETNIDQIESAIVKAKASGLPVIPYWPGKAHAGRVPIGADIVGVEAYRRKGESLAAFEARIGIVLNRCPKAAIIAQCYTSNATLDSDLVSLVPVYARLAKAHPNVWGILAFSGSGRATGLQDHPEVRPSWESLAAGIPSAPHEDDMKAPKVTVLRCDHPFSADGFHFITTDGNGDTIDTFTRNGSWFQKITNSEGQNQTVTLRPVL